jgi:hypothetical protein
MKSFKDSTGHAWDLSLTIGRARLIKSRFDIDVVGGDMGVIATRLHNEPMTRMDIIYLLLADNDGFSQEAFEDNHDAKSYLDADEAFWEEFGNFTQSLSPNRGEAISKLIKKMKQVSELQSKMTVEMAGDPVMIQNMERVIKATKEKASREMEELVTTFEDPEVTIHETAQKLAGQTYLE